MPEETGAIWGTGGLPSRPARVDDLAVLMGGPGGDDPFEVPGPTHWPSLAASEAPEHWEDLRRWVEALCVRFSHLDHHVVPPCWWRHNGHVEALCALWDHERSSFSDSSQATAPLEWLRALRDVAALLRAWTAESGCGPAHREPPVGLRAPSEDEWGRYVAADAARRHAGATGRQGAAPPGAPPQAPSS